jgi:peptidoglycan/xylan/chitin deacetylase (PgdA/CDA1 family)
MEYIRRFCVPLRLRDLVDALEKRNPLPRRGVVVTFDDGYIDNHACAYQILKTFEIPATIFVTTGSIGSKREFWWDDLERILVLPEQLPTSLTLGLAASTLTVATPYRSRSERKR